MTLDYKRVVFKKQRSIRCLNFKICCTKAEGNMGFRETEKWIREAGMQPSQRGKRREERG